MNKIFTFIGLLILSACCKNSIEVNRYLLNDVEKESIPYVANENIPFIHTNGFEFELYVTSRFTELKRTESEHCGDNYTTFESLSVDLTSNIPELYINLETVPTVFYSLMTISINKYYFDVDITANPTIDTLTINGKQYNNIYQINSYTTDTLTIIPQQILYNKEFGILQITMTNNEDFTINQ